MSVVVPYRDSRYYALRPNLAIRKPGEPQGAIDLDGRFGLHPALEPLLPLWKEGRLAFVHAAGSPDSTRSHFDAQDYMETGTPGVKVTSTGWMNRLLAVLPDTGSALRGLSVGPTLPVIFHGNRPVASIPMGGANANSSPLDRKEVEGAFSSMYAGRGEMGRAYQEGLASRRELARALQEKGEIEKEMKEADRGAPPPSRNARFGEDLAELIRKDPRIQLAFLAFGGWDTHVNQGGATGVLSNRLSALGKGIAQFAQTLGEGLRDTTVVVLSEFGRTVRENGNGGTDHGHGNVMWVLGGEVRGGKVYGDWPGLSDERLYEKRDLPATTDFRAVLSRVAVSHLRLTAGQIAEVFPQFPFSASALPGLFKA